MNTNDTHTRNTLNELVTYLSNMPTRQGNQTPVAPQNVVQRQLAAFEDDAMETTMIAAPEDFGEQPANRSVRSRVNTQSTH